MNSYCIIFDVWELNNFFYLFIRIYYLNDSCLKEVGLGGGRGGRGVEDEEERSRMHAGNYIFKTDVTQLVISRNCKKKFCCSKFSGCGAHAPKSVAVIEAWWWNLINFSDFTNAFIRKEKKSSLSNQWE